jgi:hypothetical protein
MGKWISVGYWEDLCNVDWYWFPTLLGSGIQARDFNIFKHMTVDYVLFVIQQIMRGFIMNRLQSHAAVKPFIFFSRRDSHCYFIFPAAMFQYPRGPVSERNNYSSVPTRVNFVVSNKTSHCFAS